MAVLRDPHRYQNPITAREVNGKYFLTESNMAFSSKSFRTFKSIIAILLSLGLLSLFISKKFFTSTYPMNYGVGRFDTQFGISKERFQTLIEEASSVWERSAGVDLFTYDSSSSFKVNLVFDERQQRTLDARRLRAQINENGKSYNMLEAEYTSVFQSQEELQRTFDSNVATFEQRMNERNAKVSSWNNAGGAKEEELHSLQREDVELNEMRENLEKQRFFLNEAIQRANALAMEINALANKFNLSVENYNGKFVRSREFEQGTFDGRGINIYQFEDDASLKIALIHELGHALGFAHVDDPESIMYYKLERQDAHNIHLSDKDRALLTKLLRDA